jgi:branched-chain amino acid transport system ATP-binding protein
MKNILEVRNLTKRFEGLTAVDDVSLEIEEGKIVSLIGPNGAGKTTFFNCITGVYKVSKGEIFLYNINLTKYAPYEIAKLGVGRTFQNIRLFSNMTVIENVMCGKFVRTKSSLFDIIFNLKEFKEEEEKILKESVELLKFVGLSDKLYELASNLSYGEQRRLEIARTLATEPSLLLLDEPAAGMNTAETNDLMDLIKEIKGRGITVFLIEHDMKFVMNISDKVYVLNYGKKIAEGSPLEIQKNKRVIEAYLGEVEI